MKTKSNFSEILLAIFICAGFVLMIVSCSKDQAEPKKEDPKVDRVTYDNFVGALFQAKCSNCHTGTGGGVAKWAFKGYQFIKDNSLKINNAVLIAGSMPLGGSLSASEKEKLKNWFDTGLPEK